MTDLPRVDAATTAPTSANWVGLVAELDRWAEVRRIAAWWLRDDDAIESTRALDEFLGITAGIPVGLAVIPAAVRSELSGRLAQEPRVAVLQHGWRHANHVVDGKKSEYPAGRDLARVGAEIAAGRARLRALFGPRALPMFVPPWNRIAPEFLPLLPQAGIGVVSAMASRRPASRMPAGLIARDVHFDFVAWHDKRRFVGEEMAITALLEHLRARRAAVAADAPLGILTHHLVMDAAALAFLARLIALTRGHPAVRWAAAADLLP